jgi:hypothetical protein
VAVLTRHPAGTALRRRSGLRSFPRLTVMPPSAAWALSQTGQETAGPAKGRSCLASPTSFRRFAPAPAITALPIGQNGGSPTALGTMCPRQPVLGSHWVRCSLSSRSRGGPSRELQQGFQCSSQPGVSKPCHFEAHAQSRSNHHRIGGCEHRDAGLGCHREMKRVQTAQTMLGVTRDQISRL